MAKTKYLAMYNGIPMPFNDIRVFAENVMGFRVELNEDGGWYVYVNGKRQTMQYSPDWKKNEVIDDYLSEDTFFNRWTCGNLFFYKLIEKTVSSYDDDPDDFYETLHT